jgi:U3 small nucleolar RNA-associated protein 21
MIVTGDSKGRLKFWNVSSRENIGRLKLSSEVVIMELHRESSLLAVAMQDCSVAVVDIVGRNVVRTFEGHEGAITDMTMSADSRWILTSSIDATVKVWDIPSGEELSHIRLIECNT